VIEIDLVGRPVIYKRLAVTAWSDPLTALVRPTPAMRSYVMGHALRLRGLPTPRPLAVWHRRRLGLCAEGYLLQEKVPGAVGLAEFVRRMVDEGSTASRRRLIALIEQLARLVRSLHGWGLSHRDLKAANVLVSPQAWRMGPRGLCESEPDGADHAWFVDLVGVRKHRRLSCARKVQNLARLNASFLDKRGVNRPARLRFLLRYLGADATAWKDWWRQVDAATRAKVERNRRLGRPLA
jgi:hypothetical protein